MIFTIIFISILGICLIVIIVECIRNPISVSDYLNSCLNFNKNDFEVRQLEKRIEAIENSRRSND